jgi:hypothetical protein
MRNPFNLQLDEAQTEEGRRKLKELAQAHVDEEVVAAGLFRRGGAAVQYGLSKAGGGILYAIGSLINKKRAGGLPPRVFLVVTPTKLHAFGFGVKGRDYKIKNEVAVWDRAGLRISTERKMNMTMLTIESPEEGEEATLAPSGASDDPFSADVIAALGHGGAGPGPA